MLTGRRETFVCLLRQLSVNSGLFIQWKSNLLSLKQSEPIIWISNVASTAFCLMFRGWLSVSLIIHFLFLQLISWVWFWFVCFCSVVVSKISQTGNTQSLSCFTFEFICFARYFRVCQLSWEGQWLHFSTSELRCWTRAPCKTQRDSSLYSVHCRNEDSARKVIGCLIFSV